jgi:hypothetical protein
VSAAAREVPPDPVCDEVDRLHTEVPRAMREARRWLVWRAVPRPGAKMAKVPYYVDGEPRQGNADGPEDRARFASFDDAIQVFQSGRYTGIGFALGADEHGNAWQGIDLDHTDTRPELAALIDQLPGYVERSPSGTGVHAIGCGRAFTALGSNATGIEAYSNGRYFTVTGEAISGDIEDVSDFVVRTLAPLHSPSRDEREPDVGDIKVSARTVRDLRSALLFMRSDDRGLWVRMGHALKALGDVGRGLWLEWSTTSDKFDAQDAAPLLGFVLGRPNRIRGCLRRCTTGRMDQSGAK